MEDRALINDPLDHLSEVPACRDGVLPDASTGQGPGTPSTRGQKAVTVQARLTDVSRAGRGSLPRDSGGALFAILVQVCQVKRVSRYKHKSEPELSQGTQGLIGSR
jgi:hypothetical protein